jgi:hypothetical protein
MNFIDKSIILLSFSTSAISALILLNCPLYFVPATIDAISKEQFFYQKNSTNLSFEILSASPSAIADLPTPASPIIGLFFF